MELGKIAEIDNAQVNHAEKLKPVQEVDNSQKVIDQEQYKKNSQPADTNTNEVILDNVKFGYNRNSKDLFVKVTRGDAEFKYPTEDMMRVKAQLLSEIEKVEQKNS